MPPKLQLDENLRFLYICLKNSDYKSINFNSVGTATDLKPTAARMRYSRLAKAIESGMLNEKNGATDGGGPDSITEASKKRKISMCGNEDNDMNQKTPLKKGSAAPESVNVWDCASGGNIPLDDKADGTPATKRRTKVSKKKANEEGLDDLLAGSKVKRTKSVEPDTLSFAIEGASQDTNGPWSESHAATDEPGHPSHHVHSASQSRRLPKERRAHSMTAGQVESNLNAETDLPMESYAKLAPDDGKVDLSYPSIKKET